MTDAKAVIFDIDQTLANNFHRHNLADNKDWSKFHDACLLDDPIVPMMKLLCMFYYSGHEVFLLTARPEAVRIKTNTWLKSYSGLEFGARNLLMRRNDDERPSCEVKESMLHRKILKHYDIFCAFEDNENCIDMYTRNGILCIKPMIKGGDVTLCKKCGNLVRDEDGDYVLQSN